MEQREQAERTGWRPQAEARQQSRGSGHGATVSRAKSLQSCPTL